MCSGKGRNLTGVFSLMGWRWGADGEEASGKTDHPVYPVSVRGNYDLMPSTVPSEGQSVR